MDYQKKYQEKLLSAEKAAELVKSGDWVDYGWCTGTPVKIDEALAKRLPTLTDVKFRGGVLLRSLAIFNIENQAEHMCWNSWHSGGSERKAAAAGYGYYNALRYSELPKYYDDLDEDIDVAFFQVAPMNKHGYFSFGPNGSHMRSMIARAKKVVVEVNEKMPLCLGDMYAYCHIDEVDYIVEGDNPEVDVLPSAGSNDIDKAVAELVVPEVVDGATLQLGIGGMPNAIGEMLAKSDVKDLGVHTEMYVDAFIDLTEAGKITGARKNIDRWQQVYAFGAGSKKLYDFLDENPSCVSTRVSYTNAAAVISQLDNFVSINGAVDCDLFGQINAESAGTKHISGAGGQLDFVIGAYQSKGGKSFICLSSTVMDKASGQLKSRIRPTLSEGSIVTDTRSNTMYVVTEYGMANLKGTSSWQKAERLINIAHPDFRDELIAEADKMKIWRNSNKR